MLKKLAFLFGLLFCFTAHAAEMVNVEYIHMAVKKKWGIDIPYNPTVTNPKVAANMKYLLTVIDRANRELNGHETTDYGNSEYATMYAADTIATNDAVARLIRKQIEVDPKFVITTTPDTSSFRFGMSAAGRFLIDWGDGEIQEIVRDNTDEESYSHTYATAGEYTIGIDGQATEYSIVGDVVTIWFWYNTNIAAIDGSLGAIFSTIGDGSDASQRPRFGSAFRGCTNLTSIPEGLFAGISGTLGYAAFENVFYNCTGLTSIPEGLFSGISGVPAESMFRHTFFGCSGLTSIPAGLFSSITGPASSTMFYETFSGCTGLTSLPAGLFAGIASAPAVGMFDGTFAGCTGLTELPDNLFGEIGVPAGSMFSKMFSGCTGLQTLPSGLFGSIPGPASAFMFFQTFYKCTGLKSLPAGLFSGITGPAASSMFYRTFYGCSSLTGIPDNLFGNISQIASSTFYQTFYNCTNLSGPSARINGKYLYEIWPSATSSQGYGCYGNDTGLSDYSSIPDAWK